MYGNYFTTRLDNWRYVLIVSPVYLVLSYHFGQGAPESKQAAVRAVLKEMNIWRLSIYFTTQVVDVINSEKELIRLIESQDCVVESFQVGTASLAEIVEYVRVNKESHPAS